MDTKRQQKVYELLKRGLKLAETGEELPAEWAREFFPPERREYELIYNGKETEEQILADTMAVPFQEVSTFGQNGVDWHNQLIFGDNLQAMKTLLQMKADGKLVNADGTPGVR
jgi:site-specific DNA-methyltransferase (adenine-specific)/adenine-specific DNA-methyltransferase